MNRTLIVSTVLLGLVLSACSSPDPAREGAPDRAEIGIEGFLFKPATVTVAAGSTVRWVNGDEILHTATSGKPNALEQVFDGKMADRGRTFEHTFMQAGRFEYFCARHEHMRGVVIVE